MTPHVHRHKLIKVTTDRVAGKPVSYGLWRCEVTLAGRLGECGDVRVDEYAGTWTVDELLGKVVHE